MGSFQNVAYAKRTATDKEHQSRNWKDLHLKWAADPEPGQPHFQGSANPSHYTPTWAGPGHQEEDAACTIEEYLHQAASAGRKSRRGRPTAERSLEGHLHDYHQGSREDRSAHGWSSGLWTPRAGAGESIQYGSELDDAAAAAAVRVDAPTAHARAVPAHGEPSPPADGVSRSTPAPWDLSRVLG